MMEVLTGTKCVRLLCQEKLESECTVMSVGMKSSGGLKENVGLKRCETSEQGNVRVRFEIINKRQAWLLINLKHG